MKEKKKKRISPSSKIIMPSGPSRFAGTFKPHVFPDGFCVIIDTREQAPLFTSIPKGLMIKRDTLHNGDYSIAGFEDRFAVERKGISDFLAYITFERPRTVEKLKRLQEYEFKALVIESDEDELYYGSIYSGTSAEVIRAAIISFQVRYGLHVYINKDRGNIERTVLDWAVKFWNIKKEV